MGIPIVLLLLLYASEPETVAVKAFVGQNQHISLPSLLSLPENGKLNAHG